jgi:hypothetical protein
MDPVPDPLLLRKSGSCGNRTRDLLICSQELYLLFRFITTRFSWTLWSFWIYLRERMRHTKLNMTLVYKKHKIQKTIVYKKHTNSNEICVQERQDWTRHLCTRNTRLNTTLVYKKHKIEHDTCVQETRKIESGNCVQETQNSNKLYGWTWTSKSRGQTQMQILRTTDFSTCGKKRLEYNLHDAGAYRVVRCRGSHNVYKIDSQMALKLSALLLLNCVRGGINPRIME